MSGTGVAGSEAGHGEALGIPDRQFRWSVKFADLHAFDTIYAAY